MGHNITLTAKDGHKLGAYRADPAGKPKGAIIVIQEIFGVNQHMRKDADKFAKLGYVAIAPALFDRIKPGVDLGYTQEAMQEGFGYVTKLDGPDKPMMDIAAAVEEAKKIGKVGAVGYCWGGSLAWLCATRLGVPASSYYGGRTASLINEQSKAPCIMHYGAKDKMIPQTDVDKIKKAHPEVPVYVYDADHGFNCDERHSYDKAAAELALQRTVEFFAKHVG
ncbi:MAG: dienelactone hydrolase family protein [Alphaproteobacteria bacterium]